MTSDAVETSTETVNRTISCKLESSGKKNQQLENAVQEYGEVLSYMADMIVSVEEQSWTANSSTLYRMARREFGDDCLLKVAVVREAQQRVATMFKSWRSNGKPGESPSFEDTDYLELSNQEYSIHENERGYGLKARFIPNSPVWWHLDIGEQQEEYIERVFGADDETAKFGSAKIVYNDGDPFIDIVITYDVEVVNPDDVEYVMGVDLGENKMYAVSVRAVESGDVCAVSIHDGSEFRHHRKRLSKRRDEFQKNGDLSGVKDMKNARANYTDNETHVAAREIVDMAVEYRPCVIRIEDLKDYRKSSDDPIHDWPYQKLQSKIMYKATDEGIPVQIVPAQYTSSTCRKCGHRDSSQRDGHSFECDECGYQVHADVNAAMNIAVRTPS